MNKWCKLLLSLCLLFPVFGGILQAKEKEVKDVKQPRVYSLVVDRFFNGNRDNNKTVKNNKASKDLPLGGDFEGITSKLDYIHDMGFNTIHLSPVFSHEKNDFLGYKVKNYNNIDDILGGEKSFNTLIAQAHEKNMKVIVDMPATYTNEFENSTDGELNNIQKDYFKDKKFIDLKNKKNQSLYKNKVRHFVNKYKVDGVSMNVVQDGIDANDIFPSNIDTYAIMNKPNLSVKNFKYESNSSSREEITNAFKNVNNKIPNYKKGNEILMADSWFTKRFTKAAADENMFPGTRIKQMMAYMWGYKGPVMMNYGTEIAMNGDDIISINQLLDFRTDKEVVEYLEKISNTFKQYQELYEGTMKPLNHEKGDLLYYYDTNTVDFLFNINDSSKSQNVTLDNNTIEKNKMLSGLLIGDNVKPKEDQYNLVTNREEAELYAIIDERGLNNSYFVAALLVIVLFGLFIYLVSRKSRKNKRI